MTLTTSTLAYNWVFRKAAQRILTESLPLDRRSFLADGLFRKYRLLDLSRLEDEVVEPKSCSRDFA